MTIRDDPVCSKVQGFPNPPQACEVSSENAWKRQTEPLALMRSSMITTSDSSLGTQKRPETGWDVGEQLG